MVEIPVYGDTQEAVAYALMRDCLHAAGKLNAKSGVAEGMPEEHILALYGRCLATVRTQINSPVVSPKRPVSDDFTGR